MKRVESRCLPPSAASLASLDATAVLEGLRARLFTCEALCRELIARAERYRVVNAFSWFDPERVMGQAKSIDAARELGADPGILGGLPIAVKDNIDTIGFPTSAGTPALKAHYPRADADVWARLASRGAILFGKTNMHELAAGGTTSNPLFGATRNPLAYRCVPGGSSGGAAAAVAAHIVPASLGTDTSGSVRMPAALCGIAGLRPSGAFQGSYSRKGVVPLVSFLDTIGPMARSVRDIQLLHSAITGHGQAPTLRPGELRIGLPRQPFWCDLDAGVAHAAEAAIARLRAAGATFVPVDFQQLGPAVIAFQKAMGGFGRVRDLRAFLREEAGGLELDDLVAQITSLDVRAIYESREPPEGSERELLEIHYPALLHAYCAALGDAGVDAVAFPTSPITAHPIREAGDRPGDEVELNGRMVNASQTTSRHTRFAAGLGLPAISIPCGAARGLPVGLEIAGTPGADALVIAMAHAAESALGISFRSECTTLPPAT